MGPRLRLHRVFPPLVAVALALSALAGCTALAPGYANLPLNNLFDAERAFARAASVQGVRAAFSVYMAQDAVVFRPGPVSYHADVASRPAPAKPSTVRLEWAPQAGAIARSGDLGFTTGPYRVMKDDTHPPVDQGYFFSIWKQTQDGWRVALDAGVQSTAPPPQEGLANFLLPTEIFPPAPATAAQLAASRSDLLARERAPRSLSADALGMGSYYDWITDSTRWQRTGPPAQFGPAIRAELVGAGGRLDWVPVDAVVAKSNDFAYSYGSFTRTTADGHVFPGYYVHVWQRNDFNDWKLSAVVWLPPE
jgi:hypothetical protein